MSRAVATLVYSKQVGSMARKAVLAYFADRANDDGSGVWASKQRVADEIECSKQTVITTVKGLLADGLVIEVGQRSNRNGYTVEYSVNLEAVSALPDSKIDREEVQNLTRPKLDRSTGQTPRGQGALPKPSFNRPKPQKAAPSSGKRATSYPANFHPVMTGKTAETVDGWPPGRIDDELEHFADHHTAKGTTSYDWQASWRTWVKNSKKWEPRNGTNQSPVRPGNLRGSRPDPALDLYLAGEAELRANGSGGGEEAHWGTWNALQAIGSS